MSINNQHPYRSLSLVDLIRLVAVMGDRLALDELIGRRPVFHHRSSRNLLFHEFLSARLSDLRSRHPNLSDEVLERAIDLTTDKFTSLPSCSGGEEPLASPPPLRRRGGDCRHYYLAFLDLWDRQTHPAGALEAEDQAACLLQRLVERHLTYSLQEALRSTNTLVSRYRWSIDGKGFLMIYLPRALGSRDRRQWLVDHIPNPDPRRPGEKERVQAIVDSLLSVPHLVGTEDIDHLDSGGVTPFEAAVQWEEGGLDFVNMVAREKAESWELQRPAIAARGKQGVHDMVFTILTNLLRRDMTDEEMADFFGLSKATYSRFGGNRRCGAEGDDMADLWCNVAHLLASYKVFREVAQEVGVWREAEACIKAETKPRVRLHGHA